MRKFKTLIAAGIAAILIFVLAHPSWLPLSQSARSRLLELEKSHFLIENSGKLTFAHIITVLMALCVVWLVYTIIKFILLSVGKKGARARTVTELIISTIRYLAVILAVIWCLSILGVNTTAVLAGVGIIGLILGFGAQSLIEDIITGAFIIFEGQYNIGDIIVLDDFRGIVRNIGVRTTTIEDVGGNLKVVNNSDIRNFQNRSRKNSLAVCDVDVAYDTDIPRMEQLIAAAMPKMYLAHQDLYMSEPVYYGIETLAESGMTLRFVIPVKEVNVFVARRQFNRDIRILFSQNGVEIPFPQVDVHQK
ncbi:MAG: mechanosensitive ion channel family protein [Oscillospiraceae bacterium]|nr:mechanosensitive ion channel family protein [Oscillospiraceae bacterium]